MEANQRPIRQWQFKHKPLVSITYSLQLEEVLAAVWAGLSLKEYYSLPGSGEWVDPEGEIPLSKEDIVAAFRMDGLISAVAKDADNPKGKR